MINFIEVINDKNESLKIDLFNQNTSGFNIRKIDGLDPVKADITTTKMVTTDGSTYNSSRANERNIVITLGLNIMPELGIKTIEDCRQRTYKYFPLKKRVKFIIYTDNHTLYTYGYVESNEVDIFSDDETASISLLCPNSWLKSVDDKEINVETVKGLFKFPFEVLEEALPPKDIYGHEKEEGLEVVQEYQDVDTFYGNELYHLYNNKNMYMDLEFMKYSSLNNYTYKEIETI